MKTYRFNCFYDLPNSLAFTIFEKKFNSIAVAYKKNKEFAKELDELCQKHNVNLKSFSKNNLDNLEQK